MYVVTVRFTVRAGFETAFLERVRRQASESLTEAGCRQFDVGRALDDAACVLLYEVYDDAAAFAEHLRTPHFTAFDADTRAWVAAKIVERWARIPSLL